MGVKIAEAIAVEVPDPARFAVIDEDRYLWRIRLGLLETAGSPSQYASHCPASGQTGHGENSPAVSVSLGTPNPARFHNVGSRSLAIRPLD
jgi:hypothetical protein